VGERLDEQVPGSGLGLPIVRDLAELYGGNIHLEHSDKGGVKAVLMLPKAK
jgi:signal transduction histidine kinase